MFLVFSIAKNTCVIRCTCARRRWRGDGFESQPNSVITTDVKICSFCFYVSMRRVVRIGEMPWQKIDRTYYFTQLRLSDKCFTIKRLFVFFPWNISVLRPTIKYWFLFNPTTPSRFYFRAKNIKLLQRK